MIEKNQRIGPKICAGGLTSQIFSLGLPIELTDRQFFSFNVHCFNKLIEIKDKRLLLATINRSRLGQWMLGQIPGGVEIFTDSNVTEIRETSLLLDNDREILFDYLIGADGSLSLVRKYLNLPIKKILITLQCNIAKKFETLQIFFNPNTIGPGYFWIFPVGNNESNVGIAVVASAMKKNKLNFLFFSIKSLSPILNSILFILILQIVPF